MTTAIDLSQLPAPQVIETLDFETILAGRRAYLVSLWPEEQRAEIAARLELESDPLHKVLQENAYRELVLRERINDSALQEVIVTDTIPLNPDKDLHKFTVLSVADMFADVIERVHNYKEISSIFFK